MFGEDRGERNANSVQAVAHARLAFYGERVGFLDGTYRLGQREEESVELGQHGEDGVEG